MEHILLEGVKTTRALYEQIAALLPKYDVQDIVLKYGSGTASIGLERYYIFVRDEQGVRTF